MRALYILYGAFRQINWSRNNYSDFSFLAEINEITKGEQTFWNHFKEMNEYKNCKGNRIEREGHASQLHLQFFFPPVNA